MPVAVSGITLQAPRPHDTTHSPLALYQFAGDLQDASGNGRHLTLGAGTAKYGYTAPGLLGFVFDGTNWLVYDTIDTALHITGNITVEAIVRTGMGNAESHTVATLTKDRADGIGLTENYLWGLYLIDALTDNARFTRPYYFAEHGMGVNIEYTDLTTTMHSSDAVHVAMVRQSQQITFYAQGHQLGATSGTLTTPQKDTAGNLQKLFIGRDGLTGPISKHFILSSLKVIGSALTAAQVLAEYERTIGTAYRTLHAYKLARDRLGGVRRAVP